MTGPVGGDAGDPARSAASSFLPLADYPPHVGADRLRTYTWKPAMVHESQREGMPLLYLDAGDLCMAG